jgi:CO/xanthine dehydrogenase FAD-binding subunit
MQVEGDRLRLGAMVSLQRLVSWPPAGAWLAEAACLEAPLVQRNAATLGGLIARRNPLSCLLIALLTLDAQLTFRTASGQTCVSLADWLADPGDLPVGTLITDISLLAPTDQYGLALERVARTPRDRPIVAVAVRLERQAEICRAARIALAGVAGRPLRVTQAEALLQGQVFDTPRLEQVAGLLESQLAPHSDWRGSAEYRRAMAGVLTRRALNKAWAQLAQAE